MKVTPSTAPARGPAANAPAQAPAASPTPYARLVYDTIAAGRFHRDNAREFAKELRWLTDGGYVTLDPRGEYRTARGKTLPDPEPPPEEMTSLTCRAPVSIKARLVALAKARHKGNTSAALLVVLDAHLPPLDDGQNAVAPRGRRTRP